MRNWVLATVGVLVGAMIVKQWPEIERYRRLRAM